MLERTARELGLGVGSFRRLVGRRNGLDVRLVQSEPPDLRWKIQVVPDFLIPSGARLAPVRNHVGQLEVEGPEADLRWLLAHPHMLDALEGLLRWTPTLGTQLELSAVRSDLERALDGGVAFCEALSARRRQPAVQLLQRLGLPVDPDTADEVSGEVDGFAVTVRLPWVASACWSASIHLRLPTPLPPGTMLAAKARGQGESRELDDLILDKLLHVQTTDVAALGARLSRDEVRGPLLDLLCEHPGSVVDARGIHAEYRRGALDVAARLDEVLTLARGLTP